MMLSEMSQARNNKYHISSHTQEWGAGYWEVRIWEKKPICLCEDAVMKPIILYKFSKSGSSLWVQCEPLTARRGLQGISGEMVTLRRNQLEILKTVNRRRKENKECSWQVLNRLQGCSARELCGGTCDSSAWPKLKARLGRRDSRRKHTSNKCQWFLQISERHQSHNSFGSTTKRVKKQTWTGDRQTAQKTKKTIEERVRDACGRQNLGGTKDRSWTQLWNHASWKTTAHSSRDWGEELASLKHWSTWPPLRRANSNGCSRQMETES